jgi:hypothetical protein
MNIDVLKSALPVLLVTVVMCGSASPSLLSDNKDMSVDDDMLLIKACELFTLNVFEQLTEPVNPLFSRIQLTGLIGQSVDIDNLIEETASICIYYFEPEEWGITLNRPIRRDLLYLVSYAGNDKYKRIAFVPAKIRSRSVFCR